MSTAALTLWIIAIALMVFALVFIALGRNSERGYWSQRDPSGDPRHEATPLSTIARRAGHYAAGEYRAPLRITAIGVLMAEIAAVVAVVALVITLAG